MKIQDLEQVIRDYIMDLYEAEYIGKIHITALDPQGYHVEMGLNVPNRPWVFHAEVPDDKFLTMMKEELKGKRWNLVHYGELNLREQSPDCQRATGRCTSCKT